MKRLNRGDRIIKENDSGRQNISIEVALKFLSFLCGKEARNQKWFSQCSCATKEMIRLEFSLTSGYFKSKESRSFCQSCRTLKFMSSR